MGVVGAGVIGIDVVEVGVVDTEVVDVGVIDKDVVDMVCVLDAGEVEVAPLLLLILALFSFLNE